MLAARESEQAAREQHWQATVHQHGMPPPVHQYTHMPPPMPPPVPHAPLSSAALAWDPTSEQTLHQVQNVA
eukprot:525777-Pelagomonas_calceolata.AAC.2